jgi:hypothetical protein
MKSRSFVRALWIGAGVVLLFVLLYLWLRPPGAQQVGALPENFDTGQFTAGRPRLDAPYLATDLQVVDAMLGLAQVRPGDYVIDLGTGDGRILIAAARSFGARGLGVDIDPARLREAETNARAAGVDARVAFRREDLFDTPLAEADLLTLYLAPEVNLRLRPRILTQMRPGTRVVSHAYDMGEWRPDQRLRVGTANVYLWIVPARIEGRWLLTDGTRTATLELDQQFQAFIGTATANGRAARVEQGSLAGSDIRFLTDIGSGRRVFEGRLNGDTITPASGAGWRMTRIP